jgi:hypothetical protein
MAMVELAERVSILEVRMEGLSEAVRRADHKAETSMGRQDFLAENLTEVRATVTRIERTQQGQGQILVGHGQMLEDQGKTLKGHGQMLEDQGKTLKGHGQMLEDQGKTLENHGQTLENHGQMLENQGKTLENHGQMLEDHGNILRQILAKLNQS